MTNNNHIQTESLCITPEEVRKLLHISKGRVYEMIRDGEIPYIRNGRRYLIVKSLLMETLRKKASEAKSGRSETNGKA